MVKKAINGEGNNTTITNGTIDGTNVTVKNTNVYGTPITLAYFKGEDIPPFDSDLFLAISQFDLISAKIELQESLIEYDIVNGFITKEEGNERLKIEVKEIIDGYKEEYPRVTVNWP